MGIVVRSKDKNVIKKISEEILGKYAEDIESLYVSFEGTSPDLNKVLLLLPDHQRKTFEAMTKLKEASAEQVASETKRARAIESAYLIISWFKWVIWKKGRKEELCTFIFQKNIKLIYEIRVSWTNL